MAGQIKLWKGSLPKHIKLSLIALLASNMFSVFGILFLGWSALLIIYGYFAESAIIVFFTILKSAKAKKLGEIYELKKDGTKVPLKRGQAILVYIIISAIFFGAEFVILTGALGFSSSILFGSRRPAEILAPLSQLPIMILLFLASHSISFYLNFIKGREYEKATVSGVMVPSLLRIIPSQFAVVLGGFFVAMSAGFGLVLTAMILIFAKTGVDVFVHLLEHRMLSEKELAKAVLRLSGHK